MKAVKLIRDLCLCALTALALWSMVLAGIDWEMERREFLQKPPIERIR